MKNPEPVSDADADAAVARILARHRDARDPHLDDYLAAAHDLDGLLSVLRAHRADGLNPVIARADQLDGLILHTRRWWDWVAEDLWLLTWGETLGSNRKRVAATLGLTSGQGIVDRIAANRRKLTMSRGEPDPGELAASHDPALATRQQHWLDHHRASLDLTRAGVLTHTALASDEAYDWLHEVAEDPWKPTTMTLMTYAIEELRDSPAVAALIDDHPLHTVLADWSALAADYHRIH
jgi:hypothetical protein